MNNYDDIINLEHYNPKYHKRMDKLSRASQFAPFAALNGYEDNINEAKRYVSNKIILTNEDKLNINNILINLNQSSKIKVTHFIKDKSKHGGTYEVYDGYVQRIDSFNKKIIFKDKTFIYFDNIYNIDVLNNF